MRIGIVTHWKDMDNYGAALQSFALQRYLRDLGHEAFVLRYYQRIKDPSLKQKFFYVLKHPMLLIKRSKNKKNLSNIKKWNQLRDFDSFRKNNIAFSESVYNGYDELRQYYPHADLYITGSDQVWGCSLAYEQNRPFFLDFGDEKTKRVAYAASFGRGFFPCVNEELFRELLSRFSAISMREESGVHILREMGIESIRCLDSTLLLPIERYQLLASERKHKDKYAYFYTVNVSSPQEIYWGKIKKLFERKGIQSIVTTGSGYLQPEEMFGGAIYDYATVEEWLSNIENAEIVVTASFHGVVFSYLYHKNFIYMPLKAQSSKGNNRITDFLESVGLLNRIAKDWSDVVKLTDENIDYTSLNNNTFQLLLSQSKDYLHRILQVKE